MKRKLNAKNKKRHMAASRLKTKRRSKAIAMRKGSSRKRPGAKKKSTRRSKSGQAASARKIVRIMGHGQFTVDSKTLKKLNDLDNAIVELVSQERSDDTEFKRKLAELSEMVVRSSSLLIQRR